MNKIRNIISLLFISVILCFIIHPLFGTNELYLENNQIFNLKHYRSNQIFSKTYYRNLISFYFFEQKIHDDILDFFKKNQPEFYWLASELWEKNILESKRKIVNPALKVWDLFYRAHQENDYNYSILKENCDYFGELLCQWLKDVEFIYINYYQKKPKIQYQDIYTILKKLEMYLINPYYIPFMYETASWLPKYLREIGLPLESSILLKQMLDRINPHLKQDLQQELIYSIFLAGDPDFAIQFFLSSHLKSLKYQTKYFNIFNILFLSKNYEFIINNLKQDDFLNLIKYQQGLDIWTSFPLSNNLLKIRLIDILYWQSKNEKEILTLIEKLINNNELNELEKQYARLVQSRIIYNYNIELAQRIAEDVQFKSQEKAFYLLEYYATIWNGWCLYKQKKYYLANIEFTKANNIARRHFIDISKYSVYLGLFLTRQIFNIIDLNLILELSKIEHQYFPDPYFFQILDWLPEDVSFDVWKDIYIDFLVSKKKYDVLFDFILNQYQKPWIFAQRKNVGSFIGLPTSYIYCKYIKCEYDYNREFNFNIKLNPKNIEPNSVFFYQTKNFYYALLYHKKWILYKTEKKVKEELLNAIYKGNQGNYLNFILNPKVDITHKEILEIFNVRARFRLFYKDVKILKTLSHFTTHTVSSCSLSNNDTIISIKNIKINYEHPFLTKFHCHPKTTIRLWDLERFFNENKILLLENNEHFVELYQLLYFISMYKNWFIYDISQYPHVITIDFLR